MINLNKQQEQLYELLYNVLLNPQTSVKERALFKGARDKIEAGKAFDPVLSELFKQLMYLPQSKPVVEFAEAARQRMRVGPGTAGTHTDFLIIKLKKSESKLLTELSVIFLKLTLGL